MNVTTYHNDIARTGQNLTETVLTPLNVKSNLFGKLFSQSLDSYVYAQPLYLSNLSIPGKGVHNVFYVATQHDSVYAFDADASSPALWHVNFLNPTAGVDTLNSSDISCGDMPPEVGITGTPVININTGTLYVVVRTKENGVYFQRLHALDVTTGVEKFGGPVVIQASYPGTGSGSVAGRIAFDPLRQNQRAALLLKNGLVFIAWASQCDVGPYHGWVMAYAANTIQQKAVWVTTPNGADGAIWQSGAGPAADSFNNIYFASGNGTFSANTGGLDYGDSIVKLSFPGSGAFAVSDYFTPFDQASLNAGDRDLGSAGPILLPDPPTTSPHPHLLVQAGKEGTIYLIDRDSMGHFNATDNSQIVQSIPGAIIGGWSTPAWWDENVYFGGSGDSLKSFMFHVSSGLLSPTPDSESATLFNFPGVTPSISANGRTNGILWALQEDAFATHGAAVLHAYNATNLSNELYNSNQVFTRDNPGSAVKFAVPTIANGKVYVGSEYQVAVYGVLPPDFLIAVTPQSQAVSAGQIAAYQVTATSQGRYRGTVELSASGLCSGCTATFTPASVNPSATSSLNVATNTSTTPGTYTLIIIGKDTTGAPIHRVRAIITVNP